MPSLVDLEPEFIRYESRVETWNVVDGDPATWRERGCPTKQVTGPREYKIYVGDISRAQGLMFLCPKCWAGSKAGGIHLCEVTFAGRGVPDELGTHNKNGQAVRWQVSGSTFADLTTTPSILLESGCNWHGFITNGEVN
jgi:hypothetical protein